MAEEHRSQVCHVTTTPINHCCCSTIITLGSHVAIFSKRTTITGIGKFKMITILSLHFLKNDNSGILWIRTKNSEQTWENDSLRYGMPNTITHWLRGELFGTRRNEQYSQGKKMYTEWRIKVSLHKIKLHVTSLLTQKRKHFIFLLPFLRRVVWFRNVIHLPTPWWSAQHPSSNSFLSVLDKCHYASGINRLWECIRTLTWILRFWRPKGTVFY